MGKSNDFLKELPSRIKRGRQRKPKFLAVDFFCGAGGTTRGLIDAGGYVIAGIDKVKSCAKTYVANNGNETLDRSYPTYLPMDIFPKTIDYIEGEQARLFEKLDALIPASQKVVPDVPLLFAICAPCQPFTKLSKAEMSNQRVEARLKDRSLLDHACRFVQKYMPDMILSENVAAISDKRYGGIWEDFAEKLRTLGYSVSTTVVCTSDFGVPQYRRRSILAAYRKDKLSCNSESYELPESDLKSEILTVAEALADLPPIGHGEQDLDVPNHRTRGMNELNEKRLSYAKPGESNAYLDNTPEGDLSLGCHRRVNKKMKNRCFTDVYTRMAPDRPSPTITTRCSSITNGRFGHFDINQIRGISMREAARLQSFRDDYIFYPVNQIEPVAKMIGNAVPPKLAEFYASHLVKTLQLKEGAHERR